MIDLPPNQNQPESTIYVSPQFRVGNPELTREFIHDSKRLLIWERNPDDDQFAAIAGWQELPHAIGESVCALEIPTGTRSGASVLSGMEAWRGEKENVLDSVVAYAADSLHGLSMIDGNLSLYTTAVTKNQHIFFTPPHSPVDTRADINQVFDRLEQEASEILNGYDDSKRLIGKFTGKLRNAGTNRGDRGNK